MTLFQNTRCSNKITNYYVAKFNENHKNIAEVKVVMIPEGFIFIQSAGTASENNGVTDDLNRHHLKNQR